MTEAQCKAWIAKQRREYAAGTLPQWKIDQVNKIPGWDWGVERGPVVPPSELDRVTEAWINASVAVFGKKPRT